MMVSVLTLITILLYEQSQIPRMRKYVPIDSVGIDVDAIVLQSLKPELIRMADAWTGNAINIVVLLSCYSSTVMACKE
jgi:hypothetical protein